MGGDKTLREISGRGLGEEVFGYEMHMGRTQGTDAEARPFLTLNGAPDGAQSAGGQIMGCYLHGLFSSDSFRQALLATLRPGRRGQVAYEALVEGVLDQLARHLEKHVDVSRLLTLV